MSVAWGCVWVAWGGVGMVWGWLWDGVGVVMGWCGGSGELYIMIEKSVGQNLNPCLLLT